MEPFAKTIGTPGLGAEQTEDFPLVSEMEHLAP